MTVGELRKKLEMYKDDAEIFIGNYDDLHGHVWYSGPTIHQQEVDAHWLSKFGLWHYTNWAYRSKSKQHTILVIE